MGVGPLVTSFCLITFLKILSPVQSHSEVLAGEAFHPWIWGDTVEPIADASLREQSRAGHSVRILVGGGKPGGFSALPSLVPSPLQSGRARGSPLCPAHQSSLWPCPRRRRGHPKARPWKGSAPPVTHIADNWSGSTWLSWAPQPCTPPRRSCQQRPCDPAFQAASDPGTQACGGASQPW